MSRPINRRIVAILLTAAIPLALQAQAGAASASACRPADSTSTRLVAWLTSIVTGTDSASIEQRMHMKLPQVSASQITYVTDETVCSRAVSPYNANSTMTRHGVAVSPSGKLYVVKVGTVCVAEDPVKTSGDFVIYVTLDSKFRVLSSGLG